jgi:hypothetical protein
MYNHDSLVVQPVVIYLLTALSSHLLFQVSECNPHVLVDLNKLSNLTQIT